MAISQQNRLLALDTTLGPDALLVRHVSVWEAISTPFQLDLDLASEDDSIDLRSLLGTNVTLRLSVNDGATRYFNGRISKIIQSSRAPVLTHYRAEVVPWFSFLRLRQDCRIFQEKTVQDIVSDVFTNVDFHDFEFRLHGTLTKREYCVQYRETDFHFVSRLMEDEGLFYFFEHQSDRHIMVIANTAEAHAPCPMRALARCQQSSGGVVEEDVVDDWNRNEEFLPSSISLNDYNYKTPSKSLFVSLRGDTPFEIYDFPGLHTELKGGEQMARTRLQELSATHSVAHGQSTCRSFVSGYRFTLQDHYRAEWNEDYVLTEVRHSCSQGDYHADSMESAGGESYRNEFSCIPYKVPFRPSRATARPLMTGCQTAVVVGPSGEEIHTDKFGRVKVQFHWDRLGTKDEKSSSWIRVSQAWAGKQWGAISIPRIGQEVIVDFLEGDPDKPIIVGCVYNAQQMPPYALPAGSSRMGFKSKTIKGDGYNEISINDGDEAQTIILHAQRDVNTTVLHDHSEVARNNRNVHVANELRTQIDKKASLTVKGDSVEHFAQNHGEVVSQEHYIKAGRLILEADQDICIKVGGNHVHISSAGVYIEGTMVDVNCGHPVLNTSLGGLSPTVPEDPK